MQIDFSRIRVPSMTENIIFEHATHSISTKKFIEEITENMQRLILKDIRKYVDDLLESELLTLDEEDLVLLRTWRETN